MAGDDLFGDSRVAIANLSNLSNLSRDGGGRGFFPTGAALFCFSAFLLPAFLRRPGIQAAGGRACSASEGEGFDRDALLFQSPGGRGIAGAGGQGALAALRGRTLGAS